MSSIIRKKADFNIDDAFSESLDDKIRIYTTTSETAPLTDTILEEPPGFESSTLSLSPGSPDVFEECAKTQPPILKNKKILQNPTLKALKAKEEVDVSISREEYFYHLIANFSQPPKTPSP